MNENWDLIGHEWAVRLLQKHIRQNTLRHAYLITGANGTGRRTLALRLAQAITCPQPSAPGVPCGICRTCRQIAAGQYPDLQIVQSEQQGGVLKVEQIREIQHWLSLKPYQSPYRVTLFLRFEEANPSAANALLKTLEEAPAHALLILTASAPENLLPTIVSRCEILRLHPVPRQDILAALQSRQLPEAQAELISRLAEGRPGYAFQLAEKDNPALTFRKEALDELLDLLGKNRVSRFQRAAALAKDKSRLREILHIWLSFWRDVMLAASGGNLPPVNQDYAAQIATLANALSFDQAAQQVRHLEEAITHLDQNVNTQLQTEVLLLDWPKAQI